MWSIIMTESLGILLPSMRAELGFSPVAGGWLGAAPQFGNFLLAIPSAWILSRFSPKTLTSVSLLIGSGFILFQGWAPAFAFLLLGRFLYGITAVAREPARSLLIKQWMRPNEIVVANATIQVLFGIGAGLFILIPIVLALLDNSWRNTLYLLGGLSLIITLVWLILGRERITPEYVAAMRSQGSSPLNSIFKYKVLWLVGPGVLGIGVSFSAFYTFWPSFMLDINGVSLTKSATIYAISGVVGGLGGLGLSILVSKKGRKRLVLWLSGVLMAFSFAGMLYTDSYAYLVLIAAVNGISFTAIPIIMTIPFELSGIRPREVAVATGFIRTNLVAGTIIGPILAGSLHEVYGDLQLALTVTSLCALTLTAVASLLPGGWDQPVPERTVLST